MQRRERGAAVHRQQREGLRGQRREPDRVAAQVLRELADEHEPRRRRREDHVERVADEEAGEDAQGRRAELRPAPLQQQDGARRRARSRRSSGRGTASARCAPGVMKRSAQTHGCTPKIARVERDQRVVHVVRVHEADRVVEVRVDQEAGEERHRLAQPLHERRGRPAPQRERERRRAAPRTTASRSDAAG